MGFKSYVNTENLKVVNEAETAIINEDFRESDLQKVGTLLSKMATKKLGTGAFSFLYSEKFKKENGQTGVGAVFTSTNGVIMRYNYLSKAKKGYSVNSIDYWNGKKLGDNPDKSISFQGQNIVELSSLLFDFLATGNLDESTDGAYNSFEELVNEASASEKKEQRKAFAAAHGIKASYAEGYTSLQKVAIKQGLENEFYEACGGTLNVSSNVGEVTSSQKEWAEDQKQLGPSGVFADPDYVFQDMEEAAKVVAKGGWRSLIIAGDGGLGKTYGVKQVLTQELGPYGEGPMGKWAFYEGLKASPFGLFKLLLLNKRKLIVFDDSDSIWSDKDMTNMMKIVTSDSGDRGISWTANSTANVSMMDKYERQAYEDEYIEAIMEDPNTKIKPPSTFNFEGSMINISNMPADKFDNAIKSRAIFINLFLAQRDVLRRMATISKLQGEPEDETLELLEMIDPDAADALKGIGKYGGEVKYVTPEDARKSKKLNMRTLDIARAFKRAGVKNIKHMVSLYA